MEEGRFYSESYDKGSETATIGESQSQDIPEGGEASSTAEEDVEDTAILSIAAKSFKLTTMFSEDGSSTSSSDVSQTKGELADNFSTEESTIIAVDEKNMEHDAVEAKYGKIFRQIGSCSCLYDITEESTDSEEHVVLRYSRSWSDFGSWYEINQGQFKRNVNLEEPECYQEACEMFKMLIRAPNRDVEEKFALVAYLMPVHYPNYWNYLTEKYWSQPRYAIYLKEIEAKSKIIESCKRLLKEEDRYSKYSTVNIGRNRHIRMLGTITTLARDFAIAGSFIKDEYPVLFTYLIQQHGFSKFLIERMLVENNKLHIIESSVQPMKTLTEIEKRLSE